MILINAPFNANIGKCIRFTSVRSERIEPPVQLKVIKLCIYHQISNQGFIRKDDLILNVTVLRS